MIFLSVHVIFEMSDSMENTLQAINIFKINKFLPDYFGTFSVFLVVFSAYKKLFGRF